MGVSLVRCDLPTDNLGAEEKPVTSGIESTFNEDSMTSIADVVDDSITKLNGILNRLRRMVLFLVA